MVIPVIPQWESLIYVCIIWGPYTNHMDPIVDLLCDYRWNNNHNYMIVYEITQSWENSDIGAKFRYRY